MEQCSFVEHTATQQTESVGLEQRLEWLEWQRAEGRSNDTAERAKEKLLEFRRSSE